MLYVGGRLNVSIRAGIERFAAIGIAAGGGLI